MRILWHSTAPWSPSSYSVLTARTIPWLVRAKNEVILSTWYGLQGQPLPWTVADPVTGEKLDTVRVLPHLQGDQYSGHAIRPVFQNFECDVSITCSDVWVFQPEYTEGVNLCPWFPVDHDPVPKGIKSALEPAIYPMCFNSWGTALLKDDGIEAHYVPCAAKSDIFVPGDKKAARRKLGLKCDFLVLMVAANKDPQDRKGFGEAVTAFAEFVKTHPDSLLFLHTNWGGPVNLWDLTEALGVADRTVQPDQLKYLLGMYDNNYMVNLYHASDVLLNPGKSEGFGLPLVESQMCGRPVIASDFSTTNELMTPECGFKVAGQKHWNPGAHAFRWQSFLCSINEGLEWAYAEKDNERLQDEAREGALRYDERRVFEEYWKPALQGIEAAL